MKATTRFLKVGALLALVTAAWLAGQGNRAAQPPSATTGQDAKH